MIPLKPVKGIESQQSFEGVNTPMDLAIMLTRLIGVDAKDFFCDNTLIISPLEPSDADRRKIWIKTSGAPAIGLPIGGSYKMIYEYPPNVPFLWTLGSEELPSYLTRLSSGQLTDFALTQPEGSNYFYVILNP